MSVVASQLEVVSGLDVAEFTLRGADAKTVPWRPGYTAGGSTVYPLARSVHSGRVHPSQAGNRGVPPHPSRGVQRGTAAVPGAPPGLLVEKIMATANRNRLIKLIDSDLIGWGSANTPDRAGSWFNLARTALLFIHADGDAVARPANQRHMGSMTERACYSWTAKKCCRFGTKSIFAHDGASKSQLVSGGGAAKVVVGRKAGGGEEKPKSRGKITGERSGRRSGC